MLYLDNYCCSLINNIILPDNLSNNKLQTCDTNSAETSNENEIEKYCPTKHQDEELL